eukprot:8032665-Heterocapsa_arctica.AAC.1
MDQDHEGHGPVDAGIGQRRIDPGQGGEQAWTGRSHQAQAATGCTYGNGKCRRRYSAVTACEREQPTWMGAAHADLQLAAGSVGQRLDTGDLLEHDPAHQEREQAALLHD